MQTNDNVIGWLLDDNEPSIKFLALTQLFSEPPDSLSARKVRARIPKSKRIESLFAGQRADGGFGCHVYDKWMGAFWRLPYLIDLAIPEGDKRARGAAETVLAWLTGEEHRKHIRFINGLTRRCACQEGNALAVCCRLGMADDPRVKYLAESLISWQWPDGGWNCDKRKEAHHSSFHESVIPMWGLIEYHRATGNRESLAAARKTAEFILRHRLFRSEKTGELIDSKWLDLRYPHYWHYNILQGLDILAMLGKQTDKRAAEAIEILESKRKKDGTWMADGYHWKPAATKGPYHSPVDWWRRMPNKIITLKAMIILKSVGRIK